MLRHGCRGLCFCGPSACHRKLTLSHSHPSPAINALHAASGSSPRHRPLVPCMAYTFSPGGYVRSVTRSPFPTARVPDPHPSVVKSGSTRGVPRPSCPECLGLAEPKEQKIFSVFGGSWKLKKYGDRGGVGGGQVGAHAYASRHDDRLE